MGLFTRGETKAQITPVESVAKTAAVGGVGYNPNAQTPSMIGQYYTYQEGEARNRAMQVPAIARARNLHASVVACMPLIWSSTYFFVATSPSLTGAVVDNPVILFVDESITTSPTSSPLLTLNFLVVMVPYLPHDC